MCNALRICVLHYVNTTKQHVNNSKQHVNNAKQHVNNRKEALEGKSPRDFSSA